MNGLLFNEVLELATKQESQKVPLLDASLRIHTPWGPEDNDNGLLEFMLLADMADRHGWVIERL